MSDSQYEGLVELLDKINSNVCGVIAVLGLLFLIAIVIFVVVFFDYYDKEMIRIRKDDDARIKRIIEEYKRDESH